MKVLSWATEVTATSSGAGNRCVGSKGGGEGQAQVCGVGTGVRDVSGQREQCRDIERKT